MDQKLKLKKKITNIINRNFYCSFVDHVFYDLSCGPFQLILSHLGGFNKPFLPILLKRFVDISVKVAKDRPQIKEVNKA